MESTVTRFCQHGALSGCIVVKATTQRTSILHHLIQTYMLPMVLKITQNESRMKRKQCTMRGSEKVPSLLLERCVEENFSSTHLSSTGNLQSSWPIDRFDRFRTRLEVSSCAESLPGMETKILIYTF